MKTLPDARALAASLIGIGRAMGKQVTALLTAMDQPLGRAVGNALEVVEIVELLRGGGPADLRAVTVELTAEMLLLAGIAAGDRRRPGRRSRRPSPTAAACRKLVEIVRAQGGDPAAMEDPSRLPRAPERYEVPSPAGGFVAAIDGEAVGLAAVALGAGRARVEDPRRPGGGDRGPEEGGRAGRAAASRSAASTTARGASRARP